MKAIAGYFVLGLALLIAATGQANAQVTINFDNLPCNTYVTNQYPQVTFSSAGSYTPMTYCNPNFNYGTTFPNLSRADFYGFNHYAELTLNFTRPVKGLTFYTVASDNIGVIAKIDVYRSGSFSQTLNLSGNGNPYVPIFTDLSPYGNDITLIRIYNVTDTNGLGFDNFSFIPFYVDITNPRVGNLPSGSTNNAVPGVDISFQATGSQSGGAYSWNFTGPYSVSGGSQSSPSVTIRPTNTGTITARVTQALGWGGSVASTVNVNVVLPNITSYTAYQDADRITPFGTCDGGGPMLFTSYILGCPKVARTQPGHIPGIRYTVNAQLPGGQYLNDTSQGGIKYVQIVSFLDKSLVYGSIVCATARTQENQPDTAWQLDTTDPYNTGDLLSDPPQRFSGQSVTMIAEDAPRSGLQLYPDIYSEMDAKSVDAPFETYVLYFVGSNASNPTFQRPLGFQNNSVAYIPWRWGGQIVFDPAATRQFRLQSTTQPGPIQAQSRSQMRPYSGNAAAIKGLLSQCPGGPARATKMIDVSKFFVRQQYLDFLNREPDQGGWDFWRMQITQCAFDTNCIRVQRYGVSRAYFDCAEFISNKPALNPSNKGTDSYNREFVRQCYYAYLRRTCDPQVCDPGGFYFWVNILNRDYPARGDAAYYGMIEAFITSQEYRDRFPAVPNF